MIGEPRFTLTRLGQEHDRASFVCSREPVLQQYLTDSARALKDANRNVASVYVLVDREAAGTIAGYFTLSACSVLPDSLPRAVGKKLNRYPDWGAIRLGRLARDDRYRGVGVGAILVAHAFERAVELAESVGSVALVVDAKNGDLVRWYANLGFQPFLNRPKTLFVTNAVMRDYLRKIGQALP